MLSAKFLDKVIALEHICKWSREYYCTVCTDVLVLKLDVPWWNPFKSKKLHYTRMANEADGTTTYTTTGSFTEAYNLIRSHLAKTREPFKNPSPTLSLVKE